MTAGSAGRMAAVRKATAGRSAVELVSGAGLLLRVEAGLGSDAMKMINVRLGEGGMQAVARAIARLADAAVAEC